ncbi:MAG TPA: UDP-glucose/GDP-mannose dehydrogenase family protein, partial [Bacteroidales bacterium]|nr:UDP-glucose/GDP-mannose dehydrogenase family protein [Bacteroidales bacterium]
QFLSAGAKVRAYDPVAMEEAKRRLGDKVQLVPDPYEALRDADALLLATEWAEFRVPNFETMKSLMKRPVVFDGRNVYDQALMKQRGFDYFCIGIDTTKA